MNQLKPGESSKSHVAAEYLHIAHDKKSHAEDVFTRLVLESELNVRGLRFLPAQALRRALRKAAIEVKRGGGEYRLPNGSMVIDVRQHHAMANIVR